MIRLTPEEFQEIVYEYYDRQGRHGLPWRRAEADGSFDAYKILVSELMLQQTQVARVIPKYQQFLSQFPTTAALAEASLGEVLQAWSGLGYNRRAKFLQQAALMIMRDFDGTFPEDSAGLIKLPGVGTNTAGAILAYAFDLPAVFIETNIRTVFIHHFFNGKTGITDAAISKAVDETLDREHPRIWYWALMDYGSFLKSSVGNLSRASRSYAKQSVFHGSRRQIRGLVIRVLASGSLTFLELRYQIDDERLESVLSDLVSEELISRKNDRFNL